MSNDDQPKELHDDTLLLQETQFLAAWGQMRQQGVQASVRVADEYGMSASQFNILGLLEKVEGRISPTIRWISEQMNLDPATIVRAVDSLEEHGYVARRRDTKDRRQVFVEFTTEGRSIQDQIHQHSAKRLKEIFRSMNEAERAALIEGLHAFLSRAWQYDAQIITHIGE